MTASRIYLCLARPASYTGRISAVLYMWGLDSALEYRRVCREPGNLVEITCTHIHLPDIRKSNCSLRIFRSTGEIGSAPANEQGGCHQNHRQNPTQPVFSAETLSRSPNHEDAFASEHRQTLPGESSSAGFDPSMRTPSFPHCSLSAHEERAGSSLPIMTLAGLWSGAGQKKSEGNWANIVPIRFHL